MTKYLNFFESESGFTEAVEAGQLFFPNVSYTEEDDTVHWNLEQPADPVETPMLRMSFSTSTPGQEVKLTRYSDSNVTAMEIDGTPVNVSGDTYSIAEPGNHTAVYQFESPEIPERLFFVSGYPFSAFKSAEITTAVTAVGYSAFAGCEGLSGVTIPDSVNTIGNGAFNSCSSLQYVVLPDNLTVIEDFAFTNCQSLQSVVLPDNLTVIKNSAFFGCGSLDEVYIPSGVTSIGVQAFYLCSGLTAIYFNSQVPPTLGTGALDQTAFTSATDCPIYVPAEAVETYKSAWPKYAYRIKTMKYNITASVNNEELGQVNLDGETASEGDHVDFHVDVFDSRQYQVSSVTVTDGNGDEVEYEGDEYDYSFTMPDSDVTISVEIGEKPKYTVTVDSTDNMVGDFEFMSDDGQPSYKEGDWVSFSFNFGDPEGGFRMASVQASDCDGNSIEVSVEDEGDDRYSCSFEMPGCDVNVFITIEDTRPKYNITTSVNDSSLGEVRLDKETLPKGEIVDFHVEVFDSEANSVTSVTVTDGNGNNVECSKYYYGNNDYYFTMPASDVTVSVEIGDKIPEYNISASLNDDSLGRVKVSKTPLLEGEYGGFNVNLNDEEQYQISSVTVTDGNGNNVEWTTYVDYTNTHYYHFKMPASDVTVSVVIEKKQ